MFCAAAAKKNCSRTNFSSAQAQATESDLILEFREQCFHLLSFPFPRIHSDDYPLHGARAWDRSLWKTLRGLRLNSKRHTDR